MKKSILVIILAGSLSLLSIHLDAQVGINIDNSAPDPSAMLDVKSASKGFLPPRVALTAINIADPLTSPAAGLLVYNTGNAGASPNNVKPGYYCWSGTKWIPITIPQGTNSGDMLYWNGTQWVNVPVGINGQYLRLSNGIPTWSQPSAQLPSLITSPVAITTATYITATGGGNVSDGGAPVTARGICWDTLANPTLANSFTTDGAGPGLFTSEISGLPNKTTYYVRAYATNSIGTSYGNEVSFTTPTYVLGQSYGGGIIFYIDSTGQNGLIASLADVFVNGQNDHIRWGCPGVYIPGTSNAMGAGQANTMAIVNGCSEADIAARLCYDLVLNGYDDWFLPSAQELGNMLYHQGYIGDLMNNSESYYWSSTQYNATDAKAYLNNYPISQTIYNLNKSTGASNHANQARPVRYISPVAPPDVTTSAVSSVTQSTATGGGEVITAGNAPVTARGVCWNTSSNPTLTNSFTTDGSGVGPFVSNLTGLTVNTTYYVRAYATSTAGTVYGNEVSFTTQWLCGSALTVNHVAGTVAPVSKAVTYGTVTGIPGEPAKCWITSNLGADHQATSVDDATEASAGWYWQFNRKQGYRHDGTNRTPNTTWTSGINENLDWQPANDPCTLELGSGWRIPTTTEWNNISTTGGWTDWNGPWNSALKMHAAGILDFSNGMLNYRGSGGYYWDNTQSGNTIGDNFTFDFGGCSMGGLLKAHGQTLRCIRN